MKSEKFVSKERDYRLFFPLNSAAELDSSSTAGGSSRIYSAVAPPSLSAFEGATKKKEMPLIEPISAEAARVVRFSRIVRAERRGGRVCGRTSGPSGHAERARARAACADFAAPDAAAAAAAVASFPRCHTNAQTHDSVRGSLASWLARRRAARPIGGADRGCSAAEPPR